MFNRKKIKELEEKIGKLEVRVSCLGGNHFPKYEYCSYLKAVTKRCIYCHKTLEEYQPKPKQEQQQ